MLCVCVCAVDPEAGSLEFDAMTRHGFVSKPTSLSCNLIGGLRRGKSKQLIKYQGWRIASERKRNLSGEQGQGRNVQAHKAHNKHTAPWAMYVD